MLPNERLLQKKWFVLIKMVVLTLVTVAIVTEILPEVEAKLVVVPALFFVLVLGIIELKEMV
jgi:uncharacterized membrane protein YccC